jgi:tripartite-type tricarboxylate transporter receptor subunit TctC
MAQPQGETQTMNARAHRLAVGATLLTAALVLSPHAAAAQDWPNRNVTIVVPLGAGSASDIMARVMADQLTRQLGQTFVVENRPGAGGTIGANQVAKAAPDGYTLLTYGALGTANALYSKLPYDTLADFTPVIPFGVQPLSIVTAPSRGYKTLGDLIAAGKAKPGSLNYTSAGVGTASHFAAVRFLVSAGIEAQHIPFKGAAEAVTEVMTGRADFSPQIFTTTLPLLKDGKLQALAVSAPKRTSIMPEVPTTMEAGLKADSIYPFYSGFFVPAKTPRAIVDKLYQESVKALQAPAVQERFKTLGVEPLPMTVEQFDKFFRDDVAEAAALVKSAKIPTQ